MPSTSRSSSKTPILILVVVLLVAVAAIGAYVYFNKQLGSPSVDELVRLMPEDSNSVILVRGIPKLALDFRLEEHVETLRNESEEFRRALEEAQEELGFDPTDRGAVSEHGIDLLAPWGVAMKFSGDVQSNAETMAFFIPTSDREALDALVRRMMEQEGEGETPQELDLDGLEVTASADGKTQYAFRDDYLVVSSSQGQESTSAYLRQILDDEGGSVADADWYAEQTALLGDEWKMLTLVNLESLESLKENLAEAMPPGGPFPGPLEVFENLKTLGAAFNLDPDHLVIQYGVTAIDDPPFTFDAFVGPVEDELAGRIPGKALGALRAAVDVEASLDLAEQQSPDIQEAMQQIYAAAQGMGVDLENGVIPALGSPISLAVLEDEGQPPVGGALWIPLLPGHSMGDVLTSLQGLMSGMNMPIAEETAGDVTWYTLNAGPTVARWGIAHDHLVVAFGQNTGSTVATAMAEGGDSFLDSVENETVVDGLTSEGEVFFYLDVPAIVGVVERVAGPGNVPDEVRPFLDNLGVMYSKANYDADSILVEIQMLAGQPDGFAKMVDEAVRAAIEAETERTEPTT